MAAVDAGPRRARHDVHVHVPDLTDLLHDAYALAAFDRHERAFIRPVGATGREPDWALDLRRPLSQSTYLGPIADQMIAGLNEGGFSQVAGLGFGSYSLVGAIAAAPGMTGALIRPSRKAHGFGEIIEGALDLQLPVILVDDLLVSGRTALTATRVLQDAGFTPVGVYTAFRFGWRSGRRQLRENGLGHRCLATLTRRSDRAAS